LKVSDDQHGVRDIALSRLGRDGATVLVGGQPMQISPHALAGRWNGDYTVLWDPPPDYVVGFQAGSRGPGVTWLRRQFAELAHEAIPGDAPPVFDSELAAKVKAFQVAEGLVPDGVAGPLTLIRLAARSGLSTPRLTE
jgi:general secretion pathway protein A